MSIVEERPVFKSVLNRVLGWLRRYINTDCIERHMITGEELPVCKSLLKKRYRDGSDVLPKPAALGGI